MPLIAVIDTATPAVTAAVAEVTPAGVTVRAERTTVDARAHGELLAPQLAAALAEAGAAPGDLAAVVAGTGPGPFTGLRVGLVTAAALAAALGVPAYGVCSLDALGYAAAEGTLVATDARRKEIYWAVYAAGVRRAGPAVGRPGDVAGLLGELGAVRAVGEGARRYAGVLGLPVDGPAYPPPAALAALAAGRVRAGAPAEPLTPLYLRRPDAAEPAGRKRVLA
ncbi:MAG TPA: tRNA (adenosine(37)-N6)-threonylcarbamoyltransferase complex dimerization subunit type 1 TsaB [Micromonosporaceae bacterium]|nr:tRNA (adenosine(37)-N6)-threonylcarbamoyltransferase complex dimerization subunit type 1 TsaB [Micromonosporaceae bacterium]